MSKTRAASGKGKSPAKKKKAKTKSKVNTAAVAKNSKVIRTRFREYESAGGVDPRKKTAATTYAKKKSPQKQSGVAQRRHHDDDDRHSIDESLSSESSEEEVSISSTDDDEEDGKVHADEEVATWEDDSHVEVNPKCRGVQPEFQRTEFSDALDKEKENEERQGESSPDNNPADERAPAQRQLQNVDPATLLTADASTLNANRAGRHGGAGMLGSISMDLDDVPTGLRGLTRKESMEKRQPHVAERVRHHVKSVIFRRVKFINSDQMSLKALQLVMDHENVPTRNREKFYMLYDSVFNEALNTKRSSCEQAAGKIVKESIAKLENPDDFFTMEELCKLRRATTERERAAFFWFFGSFMDSVSGKRHWGKQKYKQLVSVACENGGQSKLVTKSDEAFGLLLFENYIDKWKMMKDTPPAPAAVGAQATVRANTKSKLRGKFTGKKSGHCKYGGWCHEGTARFNQLYKMVGEDRESARAMIMEKELLRYCIAKEYGDAVNDGDAANDNGCDTNASSTLLNNLQPPVEAYWDEV